MTKTNDKPDVTAVDHRHQALGAGYPIEVFQRTALDKPVVATEAVASDAGLGELLDIWHAYVEWHQKVMPTLAAEDRTFTTTLKGRTVWVIEDGQAFTILYPEDY